MPQTTLLQRLATLISPAKKLLAPLLLSAIIACSEAEVSGSSSASTQTPGTPVITDHLVSGDEAIIVWVKDSGADAERWDVRNNDALVCSGSLIADLTDSQQSGSCSFNLVDGSNNIYVQLCNSSGSGAEQCSNSAILPIDYQTSSDTSSTLPPGDIYLDQIPSLTSDEQLEVEWIKEQGVNGDYWHIYHNEQSTCTGYLNPSDQQERQSAGCQVDLPFGDHRLQARLCIDKPLGMEDICTDSATYYLTTYFDSGRVLATPVIEALDASLPAWETTVNWSKDTQDGSAGESWTFYHNGAPTCTGTLAVGENSSSCTLELPVGANSMHVELCTTIETYSGASCAESELTQFDAFYPYALDPGEISLSTIFITQTYESSITVNWEISSGNGVTEWYVEHNTNSECFSTSSDYRTSGSCLIDLALGANDISVVGCNYGAVEDTSSCTQSPVSSTERLELPGVAQITSPTETSTYTAEQSLSWERATGASAQSWYASVNGSDQCWETDLSAADEQSGQCDITLESGHNELQVRLCVADSTGIGYCTYSSLSSIELLATAPAAAVITTEAQTISDDQISIEWSNSGAQATSWSLTNNGATAANCSADLSNSGSTQSGTCSVSLSEGANEIAVILCNTNTAGTASCSTSESITINRKLDSPIFTSANSLVTDEHSTGIIYTPEVQDNDSSAAQLSFSLLSVDDHSAFSLNSASGAISPIIDLDYENPEDSDQNNVYQLQLEVADETGRGDSMTLQIGVANINDNPPQFNLSSTSFSVAENTTAITSISASDADGDSLTYELIATGDFNLVSFDPSGGALAFDPAPDHEAPLDQDSNNVYELNLSASDGSHTTYASLSITVSNINEAPAFAAASQELPVNENTSGNIYQAQATDPEQATLTYSASGNDSSLFDLNSETGSLSFITTPDHESPQDSDQNNIYQLDLIASDGEYQASQALSITISNVNEPPVFASTSVSLSSAENNTSFVHTIEAAIDPDSEQILTYELSGSDQSAFNLDSDTLEISFISAPDYESPIDQGSDNVYQISIVATDGEYDTSQSLSITVTDADEAPVFTSPSTQAVDYTSVQVGDIVYTAVAIDDDSGDEVSYALGGADASHFDFDGSNGALAFNQLPELDELPEGEDISYELSITASDLGNNSSVLELSIILTDDTGSAPEFASASASVDVNENTGGIIYTAVATDIDPDQSLIYALSGNDSQAFSLDPNNGELSFNSIPDYENPLDQDANNVYELSISATDPLGKQAQQALSVSVINANDTYPQFSLSSNSFSVSENTSAVTSVSATDADGDTLTFALITNADANYFVLDPSSGTLAFAQAPDYESPQDSGRDNVYELDLSAFDGKYTTYAAIDVSVSNVNEAPSFATASQDLSVNENSSGTIYTANASDPEQASLTYSASGVDLDLFNFNASSGDLSFIASPNYETPLDNDSNNIYQLTITASDGEYSSSQALSISVANVNEAPSFSTTSVDLSTAENVNFVHTVEAATDEDQGETLTYELSGTDKADFNFNTSTRQLSFVATPNYENPADSGRNNNYQVSITVSDGKYSDTQDLSISVSDVNEAPSFAITNVDLSSAENNTGFKYTVAAAIDEDPNDRLSYQLSGSDAAEFSFNTSTRELLFAATPNYENPLDSGGNNDYRISVVASDGEYSASQDISITVTDVNEAPSFTNSSVELDVAENDANFVHTVEAATDEDQGQQLTYTVSGSDVADFSFDANTRTLRFIATPNYESPADSNVDNIYLLSISVSDGQYSDNQDLTISVNDVNEAPIFAITSVSLSTAENNTSFSYSAEAASDEDQGQQIIYQLDGDDKADFSFNASTRTIIFAANPDYEQPTDANADNLYQVSIVASDGALSSAQELSISVSGLNDESPLFTSLNSEAIEYTSVKVGDIVYTATTTDPDTNDGVSYSLGGSDASHFDLDSASGELAFNQLPTMEEFILSGDIAYQLTITATDLNNNSSVLDLTINLVDDTGVAPEFALANVSIDLPENTVGSFYTADATDDDEDDTLSYSLSGVDAALLSIDSSSGELSFNTPPDYEAPEDSTTPLNTYELTIKVVDSVGKQAQQNLTINITNLNDNHPQFDLAANSFTIPENTSSITTIAATDADGDTLTFALVDTADSAASIFSLDSSSGVLAFAQAPDFETPQDNNAPLNTYELNLSAFDGSLTTYAAISVTVSNIDEAPSFTAASESLSVSENTSGSVYQAQATDPEQASLTYSASGTDASLFTLDPSNGELSFTSAPDFETPLDADTDNIYQLEISASDGANSATQALSISVTNLNEAHSFALTSVSLVTEENNASFAYIADAAIDPDQGQTLTYQLSGTDQSAFNFALDTRILSFKANPDFETPADQGQDNTYQISIVAFDADHSASQNISISVTDLNDEAPQFTSLSSQSVSYTTAKVGEIVYTAQATDADLGDQIIYALGGADASDFTFNTTTGELAFAQLPSLTEFQSAGAGGIAYALTITATDLASNSNVLDLTVNLVDDTGNAPEFSQASATINVNENITGSFYQAVASDADGDPIAYSLEGADADLFSINSSSGQLSFNLPPDYEQALDDDGNNVYELNIIATDSPVGNQAQQSLSVTVINLNDNQPQFDLTSDSFDIAENTTTVTTIAASDDDGDDLTFSLTNSTDSNLFTLDPSSGALAFTSAPDFETAEDGNSDNTYELELNVFDGSHTTTQSISVTVTNIDEAPSFASASASVSVNENSSGSFYTASASDPEQATLTYSTNGTDAELFTISSSGELSFKNPPDFETPGDSGADNVYELSIAATDGANSANQALSITVTNVNEAPSFTSTSVNLSTDENAASFTHTVEAATDPDSGQTLTYQLSGDDAADFNFNTNTRSLSFANTPDFENPADQDTDNAYQITITASDGDLEATQTINIAVSDLNDEAPQFTSLNLQTVDYTTVQVGEIIYTAEATDADAGDQVSLTFGGADAATFNFDPSSGELSFNQLPELEDFPQNGGIDYQLNITATDSANNSTDLALTINLLDDTGTAPTFAQASVSIDVDENTASTIYTAQATDVDVGDTLSYSISGTDSSYFTIDPSSGDLNFNTAPDYESPSDDAKDNTYDLTITATDSMAKQAQQSLSVTVNDLNDNSPNFEPASHSFSVAENTSGTIYTAQATDADASDSLSYSFSGTDSSLFTLDSSSGELSFINSPDYESPEDQGSDNTYALDIIASDGSNSATLALSIEVTNLNDNAPAFAADPGSIDVNENATGLIHSASATDLDGDSLTYSLGGADADPFTLDTSSGELSLASALDFESPSDADGNNDYELEITASDSSNSTILTLTVLIQDLNDNSPSFGSASDSIQVAENISASIYTASATDLDASDTLSYSLSGADSSRFSIDSGGDLSFQQAPDFETPQDQGGDNFYALDIIASDGTNSATLALTIEVTNLNDNAPAFDSDPGTVAIDENANGSVHLASASDADGDSVSYSLGGTDSTHFTIDSSSGELSLANALDFENPTDQNTNNDYELSITASDGTNSASLALSVLVQDLNDNSPSFGSDSASIQVPENTSGTIYTAVATDLDATDTITYTLSGTDSALLQIGSSSGALAFINSPDYENPQDQGADNFYELSIIASDGANSASLALSIEILDTSERPPEITQLIGGDQAIDFTFDDFGTSKQLSIYRFTDDACSTAELASDHTQCYASDDSSSDTARLDFSGALSSADYQLSDSGLRAGQRYYYQIWAAESSSASDIGVWSQRYSAMTWPAADVGTTLGYDASETSGTQVVLSFVAPSSGDDDYYHFLRHSDPDCASYGAGTALNRADYSDWSALADPVNGGLCSGLTELTLSGANLHAPSGGASDSHTDSGLAEGTTYYYLLRTVNYSGANGVDFTTRSGASATSNQLQWTTVPPAPAADDLEILSSPAVAADQISIAFASVAGASSYKLVRYIPANCSIADQQIASVESCSASDGYAEQDFSAAQSSYTDSGLQAGTTYAYQYRALNAAGSSQYSPAVSATTTFDKPSISLTSSVSLADANVISVSWSASSGIDSYSILGSSDETCLISATASSDPQASAAACAHSISASAASSATSIDIDQLDDGSALASGSYISATASSDPQASAAACAHSISASAASSATSIDIDQLDDGSALASGSYYYFAAAAVSSSGSSDYSDVASAITAPASPNVISLSPGYQQVEVAWDVPAGSAENVLYRYTESACSLSSFPSNCGLDTGSYTFTSSIPNDAYIDDNSGNGLVDNQMYYYALQASNAGGARYTESASAPVVLTAPKTPDSLIASGERLAVQLRWGSSPTDADDGVAGYEILRSSSSTCYGSAISAYSDYASCPDAALFLFDYGSGEDQNEYQFSDSELDPSSGSEPLTGGTTYYYWIRSFYGSTNDAVYSASTSAPASATPILPTPTNLTVDAELSGSSTDISIAWDEVATATSYVLYRTTSADCITITNRNTSDAQNDCADYQREELSGSSTTATTHSDLPSDTIYYYYVAAANSAVEGELSSALSTRSATVAPTITSTQTYSNTVVRVEWDASSAYDATYHLYAYSGDSSCNPFTAECPHESLTTFTADGSSDYYNYAQQLEPGTHYNFKMLAITEYEQEDGTEDFVHGAISSAAATATTAANHPTITGHEYVDYNYFDLFVSIEGGLDSVLYWVLYTLDANCSVNDVIAGQCAVGGQLGTAEPASSIRLDNYDFGVYYYVLSLNSEDYSLLSPDEDTPPYLVPARPAQVELSVNATKNSSGNGSDVKIEWQQSSGVDGYVLYRTTSANCITDSNRNDSSTKSNCGDYQRQEISGSSTTTTTHSNLPNDTIYHYSVATISNGSEGTLSESIATHTATTAPPIVDVITYNQSQIEVTWWATSAFETDYYIYAYSGDASCDPHAEVCPGEKLVSVAFDFSAEYTTVFTGLTPGTRYNFKAYSNVAYPQENGGTDYIVGYISESAKTNYTFANHPTITGHQENDDGDILLEFAIDGGTDDLTYYIFRTTNGDCTITEVYNADSECTDRGTATATPEQNVVIHKVDDKDYYYHVISANPLGPLAWDDSTEPYYIPSYVVVKDIDVEMTHLVANSNSDFITINFVAAEPIPADNKWTVRFYPALIENSEVREHVFTDEQVTEDLALAFQINAKYYFHPHRFELYASRLDDTDFILLASFIVWDVQPPPLVAVEKNADSNKYSEEKDFDIYIQNYNGDFDVSSVVGIETLEVDITMIFTDADAVLCRPPYVPIVDMIYGNCPLVRSYTDWWDGSELLFNRVEGDTGNQLLHDVVVSNNESYQASQGLFQVYDITFAGTTPIYDDQDDPWSFFMGPYISSFTIDTDFGKYSLDYEEAFSYLSIELAFGEDEMAEFQVYGSSSSNALLPTPTLVLSPALLSQGLSAGSAYNSWDLHLLWEAINGINSYAIHEYSDSDCAYLLSAPELCGNYNLHSSLSPDFAHAFAAADMGSYFYYRLQAYDAAGNSSELGEQIAVHIPQALNDSGVDICVVSDALSGAQDCASGRDANVAASAKVGSGSAGFDFSLLDASASSDSHCVHDNTTGLSWSSWSVPADDLASAADPETNATRSSATFAELATISLDACGYSDWSLPSIHELLSIADYNQSEAKIDSSFFTDFNSSQPSYWSASGHILDFSSGDISLEANASAAHSVLLVRGDRRWGHDFGAERFQLVEHIDDGNTSIHLVYDNHSQLHYAPCLAGQSYDPLNHSCTGTPTELDYIDSLNAYDSNSTWRQPNIKELIAILDPTNHLLPNPTYFPNPTSDPTSTSDSTSSTNPDSSTGSGSNSSTDFSTDTVSDSSTDSSSDYSSDIDSDFPYPAPIFILTPSSQSPDHITGRQLNPNTQSTTANPITQLLNSYLIYQDDITSE